MASRMEDRLDADAVPVSSELNLRACQAAPAVLIRAAGKYDPRIFIGLVHLPHHCSESQCSLSPRGEGEAFAANADIHAQRAHLLH